MWALDNREFFSGCLRWQLADCWHLCNLWAGVGRYLVACWQERGQLFGGNHQPQRCGQPRPVLAINLIGIRIGDAVSAGRPGDGHQNGAPVRAPSG